MKGLRSVCTFVRWSLIALSLFGFSATAVAIEFLGAEEVKQLISGKTVEAINPRRAQSSVTYFDPDGTFRQLLDGKPEKGTWSVDDDGYLNTNREHWGSSRRKITKEGDEWKLYKVPENITKPNKHMKTYTRIIDGNPNNL
ncbi:MAG: hypothetical protein WBO06_01790 [Gammaproteobacteria bacterium]